MKKSELRTGMMVENREGNLSLVMIGVEDGKDVIVGDGSGDGTTWMPIDALEENLTYKGVTSSDIVRVYSFSCNRDGAKLSKVGRRKLWERDEAVSIKLTDDYEAKVDFKNLEIKVGCQTIPFSKVKELAKLIDNPKS